MHGYVVTAHRPSSVHAAASGRFTSPDHVNLILEKQNRMEVHLLTIGGLKLLFEIPIYANIAHLFMYHPPSRQTAFLFVMTDRYEFFVMSYDSANQRLVTESAGDLSDRNGRPAEYEQVGLLDPEHRLIGFYLYSGLFKVIPLETGVHVKRRLVVKSSAIKPDPPRIGSLKEPYDLRVDELMVLSMVLLSKMPSPTLAVLYADAQGGCHICTYKIDLISRAWDKARWHVKDVPVTVDMIFPVGKGGFVYFDEDNVVYYDLKWEEHLLTRRRPTRIRCVTAIDTDGTRLLLADDCGQLELLWIPDGGDMTWGHVGQACYASCLTYVANGTFFVGSHYGDSQFLQLTSEFDPDHGYVRPIQSFTSLSPVSDFIVVDLEKQGQSQIITCSGGYDDGSLRVIRNGVGVTLQVRLEVEGVRGMWPLRSNTNVAYDDLLVLTFSSATRVLMIGTSRADDGTDEVAETTELGGLVVDRMTLAISNVEGEMLVQVTEKSARLIRLIDTSLAFEWLPREGETITMGAVTKNHVVVALDRGVLVCMEVRNSELVVLSEVKLQHDASCLALYPCPPISAPSQEMPDMMLVAVGLWTVNSVVVLSMPDLKELHKEKLADDSLPRSLMFVTIDHRLYLMASMGDGTLYAFIWNSTASALVDRKRMSMGTQPMQLAGFVGNGKTHIFAASDRPTVIYNSNQKLLYSTVNMRDVNCVCTWNSQNHANSLALASNDGITIGPIDDVQKLDIRTLRLNEMPRRIVYQEQTNTFGVVTMGHLFEEGEATSFLRIFDDQGFHLRGSHTFESNELVHCILSIRFKSDDSDAPYYYVAGTGYAPAGEEIPRKGRIVVLLYDQSAQGTGGTLCEIASRTLPGSVTTLAELPNGYIVAGVNTKVIVLKFSPATVADSECSLEPVCTQSGFTFIVRVVTRGDFIAVGDLMQSFTLLVWNSRENRLDEVAEHKKVAWTTALEAIEDDVIIGADHSGNIYCMRANFDRVDDQSRAQLEEFGGINVGDQINQFRHGSLAMNLAEIELPAMPRLVFGTIWGGIGVVATLSKERFEFLQRLEKCMEKTCKSPGGLEHKIWRQVVTDRNSYEYKSFIDGDLIEEFLDLPAAKMELVATEVEMSIEDLCKLVDELTRIH